ncbi:MAG: substrate-binding domain-containing protein [Desulfobacteraceae bacterium]|jgi:ribose transport system substrate-binding protein|nr:substrate-binding domain-containing protein [Desulfobacteraceae bacterium]
MRGRTKSFTLVVSLVFIFMVMFSAGSVCAEDQTYAMVVFLKGSEFFNWAYGGMQDAAKLLGADIKTELRGPATWDASQEARAIEQLIAKGVKGIIVTAGDATTLNPAIDKAMARGIPVITFDSDAPDSQRLCFAGTNNYEAGKVAGKSMVEWLNGEGEVGISTFPGPNHLVERIRGFKDGLAGSKVKVVATCNDEGKVAAAESAITAMLQAHPEIDAVFAAHGNPGPGAVAAVKNVGKEGKIQIMGFDFGMPVVEGIDKGQIRGTVGQNPYLMGYVGMMMAWAANQKTRVDGMHVPPSINTGVRILTKEDIGVYKSPPAFVSGK